MIKFWLQIIVLTSLSLAINGQTIDTIDNFSDGNYTANPRWIVNPLAGSWTVVDTCHNPFSPSNPYGLKCLTSGRIHTPATEEYGTWEFDFYTEGIGFGIDFGIICADSNNVTAPNVIRFETWNEKKLIRIGYNNVKNLCESGEDFIEFNTYYHIVITRASDNKWYMTIQGGAYTEPTASGTYGDQPGNTPMSSAFFVFQANPGDLLFNFTYTPVEVLPVELSSFTAVILDNAIKLNWRTETEVSNYGFEVQRSISIAQNQDWDVLGFVPGNGNSNSPKDYTFIDENVSGGKYYYRLKQIDTDGKFEYSNVIEVYGGNILDGFILEQNYPNPFNPSTTIKFALAETQNAELKIFDILGNEVATLFNGIADGGRVYEAEFNATSLSSGIYIYHLAAENKVKNRKMLLLK